MLERSEPVDDLFAALRAEPTDSTASADTVPTAPGDVPERSSAATDPREIDLGADLHSDDDLNATADADTSPGFSWNITPDPTAADPAVAAEAARRDRLRSGAAATAPVVPGDDTEASASPDIESPEPAGDLPEPDPQPEPEPAPVPAPAPATDVQTQALPTSATPRRQPEASAGDPTALLGAPVASSGSSPAAGAPAAAAVASRRSTGPQAESTKTRSSGGGPGDGGATPPTAGGGDRKRTTRTLIWVAGALVVALVLAGLYFLGTQLGGGGSAPAAAPTPSAEATPTPTPEPTAPQPAGAHAWNTLFGGECLDPFQDAWAEEFTVVDCAAPHAAQLVYRGELPGDAGAAFPGQDALNAQMADLCRAAGVIDVGAASGIGDLQVQGTYPLDEQWAAGERTYYCFVNRAGGEALTGSLQGPGPAA